MFFVSYSYISYLSGIFYVADQSTFSMTSLIALSELRESVTLEGRSHDKKVAITRDEKHRNKRRVTRNDRINLRWDIAKSTSTNISALTNENGLRVSREAVALRRLRRKKWGRRKAKYVVFNRVKTNGFQSLFRQSRVRRIDGVYLKLCFQLVNILWSRTIRIFFQETRTCYWLR